MIPENLMMPLMEFIRRAHEIPNLEGAILFGSAVKGELTKKSDIDVLLLFDTDHNPELGKEMDGALKLSSDIAKKYDLPYSFSFVVKNINDPGDVDPDFLWNVAQEGILIWGKPDLKILREPHPSLEAMMLISYSTKGLKPGQKSAIQRGLFGYKYKLSIGQKRYQGDKRGLVKKSGCRLGAGVFLVPAKDAKAVIEMLQKNGAKYKVIKLWR